MKLFIRNVFVLSIVSSMLAFYYVSPSPTTPEKLQAVTDKIDRELALLEQKNKQFRVLSDELIQQIAEFSSSCSLEKMVVDGVAISGKYSVEKGKLLLGLLERKLTKATYAKIFKKVSFQGAFLKKANLKGANLSGLRLANAYLVGAELNNANLAGMNLHKTNLSQATLIAANLKAANLQEAILNGADLSDANFTNAYLVDAKLGNNARLDRADFTGANLNGVDFSNVHPSFVKP